LNALENLYLDYDKEYIDKLEESVAKFCNYRLNKPWWSLHPVNVVQSEGGFNLLVLRGMSYVLEEKLNGQSDDPMEVGLRRFARALSHEYGNVIKENQAVRYGSFEDIFPRELDGREQARPLLEDRLPSGEGLYLQLAEVAQNEGAFRGLQSDYSEIVTEALDKLTELERDLFITYSTIGSIKELCEVTQRNYNTVKPQISRIRAKLKAALPLPSEGCSPESATAKG